MSLESALFSPQNTLEASTKLRLAKKIFEHSHEGLIITSAQNKIIDLNAAVMQITEYTKEDLLDKNPKILSSGRNSAAFYEAMWQSIKRDGYWSGELWNRKKSGKAYLQMLTIAAVYGDNEVVSHYVGIFSDVTMLKEHERDLAYITHYDSLTGLPNRLLLQERLSQAMAQTRQEKKSMAVVYLDFDGFREINEHYGHDAGDALLRELSLEMQKVLKQSDTLARIGGDEFIAVIKNLATQEESLSILDALLRSVAKPITLDGNCVQLSASLGVTFFSAQDDMDAEGLIRFADQAMYQAKVSGKNRYHIFDPVADATMRIYHKKVDAIEQALQNGEFVLYYQPKINMHSGKITGFEALIRWNHPTQGVLAPSYFLPTIEDHPLSIKVGEWVLEEVCKMIVALKEQGHHFSVSANINAMHLLKGDFLHRLKKLLHKYPQIASGELVIEILETSTLEDLAYVANIIDEAQKLGVAFALDDFGTGYSSLTYLKQLAVSQIKIDQSFIRDMLWDSDDLAIIEGVITLANAFRREIVAEGVESIAHGEMLLKLGCHNAQGYAIAKPMPEEMIERWLKEYTPQTQWLETKAVKNEKISYLHAMVEHNAWLQELLYALEHNTHSALELDAKFCHFGVWLQQYMEEPSESFMKLNAVHNELHAMAIEALKNDDPFALKSIKNELEEQSSRLRALLEDMSLEP